MSEMTKYNESPAMRFQPQDAESLWKMANMIGKSQLKPASLKTPEDVMIVLMTGVELGLSVMQSMRGIHVINGRPTMSAEMLMAVVQNDPRCEYMQLVESSDTVATYQTLRRGNPEPTTLSYTIKDAKQAGLTGGNWAKHPAAMLRARASSAICRAVYSDIIMGLYTDDEMQRVEPRKVNQAPATSDLNAKFSPKSEPVVEVVALQDHSHYKGWKEAKGHLDGLMSECGARDAQYDAYCAHICEAEGVDSIVYIEASRLSELSKELLEHLEPKNGHNDEMNERMAWLMDLGAQ